MKPLHLWAFVAASSLSLIGCNQKQNNSDLVTEIEILEMNVEPQSTQVADTSVLSGEWQVVSLNGNAVTPNEENAPFMGFDMAEMRVYGNSGCNLFSGTILLDSTQMNAIGFDRVASTRMMCPNDSIEQIFLTALNGVTAYVSAGANNEKVTLLGSDKQSLIGLEKRAAATQTPKGE